MIAASLETFKHHRAAAFARRGGERAEERLGQPERRDDVDLQRLGEILARGVGERRERHGAEARCVVDQDVEPAEPADDLKRNRVDRRPFRRRRRRCRARRLRGSCAAPLPAVRATKATRAPERCELLHERKPEAGGSAGDGDAQAGSRFVLRMTRGSFLMGALWLQVQVNLKSRGNCAFLAAMEPCSPSPRSRAGAASRLPRCASTKSGADHIGASGLGTSALSALGAAAHRVHRLRAEDRADAR